MLPQIGRRKYVIHDSANQDAPKPPCKSGSCTIMENIEKWMQKASMQTVKNACRKLVVEESRFCKPRCPVYRLVPCKNGSVRSWIKMKNGCKKPVCKPKNAAAKLVVEICNPRFCKPRCPVYRLAPCKGGSVRSWKTLRNGCKKPVCKPKQCCRKIGRRTICNPRFCKPRCPVYRLVPCKNGSVRSWIKMKNGCKKPVCKPKECCRKIGRRTYVIHDSANQDAQYTAWHLVRMARYEHGKK